MLTIKLFRMGRKNKPFYRVVVMKKRTKANGKYIDQLGVYDPFKEKNPLTVDMQKVNNWIAQGSQISEGMKKLLKQYGRKTA